MENVVYCVVLVWFMGFGGIPSFGVSDTVNYEERNFSIDQFIHPMKFLPDLSRSNNSDNSTLQRITEELLKTINHTNSSRKFENGNTIILTQDTKTVLIYEGGSLEDNVFKKKVTICLGALVIFLGCFIFYRKLCYTRSRPSISLPSIHRVDTPPPPYYLFAPPSYDDWACGRVKQKVISNDVVISIEWPVNPITTMTSLPTIITTTTTTTTTTTPGDQIVKDSINEKIIRGDNK